MAERLLICRPERIVAYQASHAGLERLLTPEPREGFFFPGDANSRWIDIDFGGVRTLDTFFLGYHTVVTGGPTWEVQTIDQLGGGVLATLGARGVQAVGDGEPYNSAFQSGAPFQTRYLRVVFNAANLPFRASVFAAGPSIAPIHGHEWDSGRLIEDTGSTERRPDGGFGIDEGVAAGGYEWSFDSLQPDEVSTLYRWAKERRTTRSILVAEEGGGPGVFPSECLHWGLFGQLERFGRRDPSNTRWAMRVRDWA